MRSEISDPKFPRCGSSRYFARVHVNFLRSPISSPFASRLSSAVSRRHRRRPALLPLGFFFLRSCLFRGRFMIRTSGEKIALSPATRAKSRQRDSFPVAEITERGRARALMRASVRHTLIFVERYAALKGEIKGSKNYLPFPRGRRTNLPAVTMCSRSERAWVGSIERETVNVDSRIARYAIRFGVYLSRVVKNIFLLIFLRNERLVPFLSRTAATRSQAQPEKEHRARRA